MQISIVECIDSVAGLAILILPLRDVLAYNWNVTVNQIPFDETCTAEGQTASAGQQVNRRHVLPVKSDNDVVRRGICPTSSVSASLAIDTHAR